MRSLSLRLSTPIGATFLSFRFSPKKMAANFSGFPLISSRIDRSGQYRDRPKTIDSSKQTKFLFMLDGGYGFVLPSPETWPLAFCPQLQLAYLLPRGRPHFVVCCLPAGYGSDHRPGVCRGDGQTEAYLKDMGMTGRPAAWAMARRRPI